MIRFPQVLDHSRNQTDVLPEQNEVEPAKQEPIGVTRKPPSTRRRTRSAANDSIALHPLKYIESITSTLWSQVKGFVGEPGTHVPVIKLEKVDQVMQRVIKQERRDEVAQEKFAKEKVRQVHRERKKEVFLKQIKQELNRNEAENRCKLKVQASTPPSPLRQSDCFTDSEEEALSRYVGRKSPKRVKKEKLAGFEEPRSGGRELADAKVDVKVNAKVDAKSEELDGATALRISKIMRRLDTTLLDTSAAHENRRSLNNAVSYSATRYSIASRAGHYTSHVQPDEDDEEDCPLSCVLRMEAAASKRAVKRSANVTSPPPPPPPGGLAVKKAKLCKANEDFVGVKAARGRPRTKPAGVAPPAKGSRGRPKLKETAAKAARGRPRKLSINDGETPLSKSGRRGRPKKSDCDIKPTTKGDVKKSSKLDTKTGSSVDAGQKKAKAKRRKKPAVWVDPGPPPDPTLEARQLYRLQEPLINCGSILDYKEALNPFDYFLGCETQFV